MNNPDTLHSGYEVVVNDEDKFWDEDERTCLGRFATYEEALAFAKQRVETFFRSAKPGMSADALIREYDQICEGAFVARFGGAPQSETRFCPRDYAVELATGRTEAPAPPPAIPEVALLQNSALIRNLGATTAGKTFTCSRTGENVGTVSLTEKDGEAFFVRASFTGEMISRVESGKIDEARRAIMAGDARALHKLDRELMVFYCPACDKYFGKDLWYTWDVFDDDGWHDSIRGICPQGHERMLED